MKIHICRTGGFAGLRRTATVETDHLSPDQAAALAALQPHSGEARVSTHPDAFTYEISFLDPANPRTVHLDESAAAACGLSDLFRSVA